MKKIGLLGASGSIGKQTLEVIENCENLSLAFASVHKNIDFLLKIEYDFKPEFVIITDPESYERNSYKFKKCYGPKDLIDILSTNQSDILLNAIVGMSGLLPTYLWLKRGKTLALANKESLVSAGELMQQLLSQYHGKILPVDSEHSAIWQSLSGRKHNEIEKLILTASGGAFRDAPFELIKDARASQALKHPNWEMGKKITIDTATLINKGLEVMEARWLFDIPEENIDVLIHRESIIHSMVEYVDGAVIAQLGLADMRLPIQYALNEGLRKSNPFSKIDFSTIHSLHFEEVDEERFQGITLARKALRMGGSAPLVLNVVNEVMVEKYLRDEISFYDITEGIDRALEMHHSVLNPSIETLLEIEKEERVKWE